MVFTLSKLHFSCYKKYSTMQDKESRSRWSGDAYLSISSLMIKKIKTACKIRKPFLSFY